MGDTTGATRKYELLKSSYTGEEARCRYALLQKKTGSDAQAAQLFEEILLNARRAPRYYRREQSEWIGIAEWSYAARLARSEAHARGLFGTPRWC